MDLSLALTGTHTRHLSGSGGGSSPAPLASVPGILDAANVVILGASIFAPMGQAAYFAQAGFTGTLHNYAVSGAKVIDAIDQHAAADAALAADRGNNLYIAHIGGNNVSGARPYPGQEDIFETDYLTLAANIAANGDKFIPLPLTKRLYGIGDAGYPNNPLDVAQGDLASEANGSRPYNENIIYPIITSEAPAFMDEAGEPFVSPYRMIDADPWVLGGDGVHGPGAALHRYALSHVAGRALGRRVEESRAGTSIIYSVEVDNPNTMSMDPAVNRLKAFPNGTQNNPLFYGALRTDGTFDPFIKARMGGFTNSSDGMGTGAYARLADPRFHHLDIVGRGIYLQGTQSFPLSVGNLTPGDSVRVSCCGFRTAGQAGNNRRGTVTLAGQSRELDAANDAVSNQVVFDPVTIPASGTLDLTLSVAPGSTYAYLHGVILDFL